MNIEQVQRLIANSPQLAKLLPMPPSFYSKYNIEPPTPVEFKDYMMTARPLATGEGELRPIASGGVRHIPDLQPEPTDNVIQTLSDSGEGPEDVLCPESGCENTTSSPILIRTVSE